MSSIRILILGAVRFMQPVHGYDVRRELQSWHLDDWVSLGPGSIYSALRTMEKDGLIEVVAREREGAAPSKTTYRITGEGEKEFHNLLRSAWWELAFGNEPLIPALTMFDQLSRAELIAALSARDAQLEARLTQLGFFRGSIRDGATGAAGQVPEHVREIIDFAVSRMRADLQWGRTFAQRLRDGDYTFAEER